MNDLWIVQLGKKTSEQIMKVLSISGKLNLTECDFIQLKIKSQKKSIHKNGRTKNGVNLKKRDHNSFQPICTNRIIFNRFCPSFKAKKIIRGNFLTKS